MLRKRLPELGVSGLMEIGWDHVGATGLDRNAIDFKLETRAPLVLLLDPFNRPQSERVFVLRA